MCLICIQQICIKDHYIPGVLQGVWNEMKINKKDNPCPHRSCHLGRSGHQYMPFFLVVLNRKLSKTMTYACEIHKNFLMT